MTVAVISDIAGDYFSISNQVVSMGASLGMAQSDWIETARSP